MSKKQRWVFNFRAPLPGADGRGLIHLLDPSKLHGIACNRNHKRVLRTTLDPSGVTCQMCCPSAAAATEREE